MCVGGNDKNAVVFNKDTEQVVAILQGHGKKVTGVIYHPDEVQLFSDHLVIQSGCDSFRGCSQSFNFTGDLQLFCVMLLYATEMNIWKEWIIMVEVGSSYLFR